MSTVARVSPRCPVVCVTGMGRSPGHRLCAVPGRLAVPLRPGGSVTHLAAHFMVETSADNIRGGGSSLRGQLGSAPHLSLAD